jgi:hypothetical protein
VNRLLHSVSKIKFVEFSGQEDQILYLKIMVDQRGVGDVKYLVNTSPIWLTQLTRHYLQCSFAISILTGQEDPIVLLIILQWI